MYQKQYTNQTFKIMPKQCISSILQCSDKYKYLFIDLGYQLLNPLTRNGHNQFYNFNLSVTEITSEKNSISTVQCSIQSSLPFIMKLQIVYRHKTDPFTFRCSCRYWKNISYQSIVIICRILRYIVFCKCHVWKIPFIYHHLTYILQITS